MGMLNNLARIFTPRQKANPAGEGNYHPGPYTVGGGILPSEWGQYLNFWQLDYDPLPVPGCSTVEACVWAYIRAIAQMPGYHKRELGNGGTEVVTTSALTTLAWDAVSHPSLSGYRVYFGTASGTYLQPPGQGINVGNVTSFTVPGLSSGIRYFFAVTAFDTSNNESTYSNEVFKDIP